MGTDIVDDIVMEDMAEAEKESANVCDADEPGEKIDEKKETIKLIEIIVSILLIFTVIFGISYLYNRNDIKELPEVSCGGFRFVKLAGLWNSEWQRGNNIYNIHFHFNPEEVKDVAVSGQLSENFNSRRMYITSDPLNNITKYSPVAAGEFGLTITKVFNAEIRAACARNATDVCADRPIINCTNTDESVIFFEEKEPTEVVYDDNCIIIRGKDKELLRATDRLLFGLYKIPLECE